MKKIFLLLGYFLCCLYGFNSFAQDLEIHGFISQGYVKTSVNDYIAGSQEGTFQLNEMGLNFYTDISGNLSLCMQFFARDIGSVGNDEIIIDWAYAEYNFTESMGLRAGRMKIPMGLYNETRDVDVVRTSVFLNSSVYWDILRDSLLAVNGVGIHGDIDLEFLGSIHYQLQAGGMNIASDSGTAEGIISTQALQEISEMEVNYTYGGGLRWNTPIPGMVIGFTDTVVDMETMGYNTMETPPLSLALTLCYDPFRALVYSLEFTWNNLVFVTEYSRMNMHYKAFLTDLDTGSPFEAGKQKMLGWYSAFSYRFVRWLTAELAYSEFYDNADDLNGRLKITHHIAWQKDITLSLRFDINMYWVVKFENHFIGGNNQVMFQNDHDYEVEHWNMWVMKVSYVF